ncbi:nitroreductase family protein [bacterium]|nr:nitroreductase family protein [bacterium]
MNVQQAIETRWSPRGYVATPIPASDLHKIFEAARASHSCFNEQPWRFLYATKDAGPARATLEGLLGEGNAFAKEPWILGLTFAKTQFTKTGATNRHAGYDLGSAAALMALQAFELGWGMRFMAGFNLQNATKLLPVGFEAYSMFTLGKADPALTRPERQRKPLSDFFFENSAERAT